MTTLASEAKITAAIILKGCGIDYDKLSARAVSFQDLARADTIMVKVHGLRLNGGAWNLAKSKMREHGFLLTSSDY